MKEFGLIGGLGWGELLIILVIILLLFGSRKLTELSRSLGKSAKEFREGFGDSKDENNKGKRKKKR